MFGDKRHAASWNNPPFFPDETQAYNGKKSEKVGDWEPGEILRRDKTNTVKKT
jgi:hypothetical protein